MAAPAFSNLTFQTGGAVQLTLAWPAHAINTVGIVVISSGGTIADLATPSGFVEGPDSPLAGTALNMRWFWCRATSSSQASVVTGTGVNNISAVLMTFTGVVTTGDPWDVTSQTIKDTSSTATSINGDTTTLAECLIVYAAARGSDFGANQYSSPADATLASITERLDNGTTTGNGGGIGMWTGVKTAAGAYGPMTATLANTSNELCVSIALKPVSTAVTGTLAATQDDNTAAFTGTVANPVTGTLAAIQDDNVGAFTGTVTPPAVTGTLAATQADNTGAFTGSVGLTGTLAATQADNVGAFTGQVANPITGILGATQDDNVANFTGQTILGGNLTAVQDDNVGAFTGMVANPVTGVLAAVQDDNVGAFTGSVVAAITGVLSAVQADNVANFTGNVVNPTAGIVVGVRSTVRQAGVRSEVSEGASSSVGGLLVHSVVR